MPDMLNRKRTNGIEWIENGAAYLCALLSPQQAIL